MEDYKFESTPKANPEAIVAGPHYRFTILTDKIFRYEWAEDGKFEDRASTFAINRDFPVPKFYTHDTEHELEIITDSFHLTYDKKRFSARGLMASFSAKVTLWGAQWRFGETGRGNLGGTARTLDEVDGRTDMGEGVVSTLGYSTIDDSTSMLFDGKGFVAGREPGDRIDGYCFGLGLDYKGAIKAFYAISGKQPSLPRWSLGNWWSRYYRYTQKEYIELMDKFKERNIPFSVAVIDMDWHLVRDDRVPHAGWTGYTWDDKLFPDPEEFGRELHKRDLKISLNDHPHSGIHHHEDSYEEMAKAIGHDTSKKKPIIFDPTSPKFMDAYLNILHRNVEKVACDFWWIDWQQGSHTKVPGVDPLWMLNHFHYLDNKRDGKEPIVFSRYAGPGSHRYPVGFSGDTITTWASLEFQPEFTSTASNIGYGWWSHDIGGHMGGYRDDELVARWIQYGVFSPILRLHSTNSKWQSKEPWLYREQESQIITDYLQLRHRLIPYLYSQSIISVHNDEPLVQPMYWNFPESGEAYAVPNQYYFGTELIVAPITKPKEKKTNQGYVKAWLPPGHRFVDIFTGTLYDGNRELKIYRPLDQIPVFAREGAILQLDGNHTPLNGGRNPDSFEIQVVIGQDGKSTIYEDPSDDMKGDEKIDPRSKPEKTEAKPICQIQYNQTKGKLTAQIQNPAQRPKWTIKFPALTSIPKDLKININGETEKNTSVKTTIAKYPDSPNLIIEYIHPSSVSTSSNLEIEINLGSNPEFSIQDHRSKIEDMIKDFQIDFSTKDAIWNHVGIDDDDDDDDDDDNKNESVGLNTIVSKLLTLSIDEEVLGPILELILADRRGYIGGNQIK